jgi:hypothetical protein
MTIRAFGADRAVVAEGDSLGPLLWALGQGQPKQDAAVIIGLDVATQAMGQLDTLRGDPYAVERAASEVDAALARLVADRLFQVIYEERTAAYLEQAAANPQPYTVNGHEVIGVHPETGMPTSPTETRAQKVRARVRQAREAAARPEEPVVVQPVNGYYGPPPVNGHFE